MKTNKTLIVGETAIDDLSLPTADLKKIVGGSAVYASLGAALFSKVAFGAIVGSDFPKKFLTKLKSKGIDVNKAQKSRKPSFRIVAKYTPDLSGDITIRREANALLDFKPERIKDIAKDCSTAYIAKMDAQTQLKVLRQIPKKTIKIVSSMGIFIVQDKDGVLDVFKKSDIVLLSEKEARLLTQDESTIPEIIERVMISGPKVVILKSGKHGFTMYGRMGTLIVPSYPLAFAVDPTGAGDALGGALAGALAQFNRFDRGSVTTAAVLASIVASFTVEGLGTQSLEDLTVEEVYNRTTVFMGQLPNSDSLRVDVKLKQ